MSGAEVRAAIVAAARECDDAEARASAARRELRRIARAERAEAARERRREAVGDVVALVLGYVGIAAMLL